jgi:hypothetical protein
MQLELVIRYVGEGLRCDNCGKRKETTRYQLRDMKSERQLEEFLLCDSCQDDGYVIGFNTHIKSPTDYLRSRRISRSRDMEASLARDVKGKVQPGSGNQDEKADVRVMGKWRLEHKFTDSVKGYHLKVSDLSAVIRHANMAGEWPAMIIAFPALKRKFVTITYEVFLHMIERLDEKDGD